MQYRYTEENMDQLDTSWESQKLRNEQPLTGINGEIGEEEAVEKNSIRRGSDSRKYLEWSEDIG